MKWAQAVDHAVLQVQSSFTLPRDRDAYGSIRGFVYQVDLTILRWLDLDGDEILELERGEDIDRLSTAIDGSPEGFARLLEQVKVCIKNVTLKSAEAVEAIANASEHLANNQKLRLGFRFFTNAKIGRERRHPYPTWKSGLLIWEELRCEAIPADQRDEAIESAPSCLERRGRPNCPNLHGIASCRYCLQQAID